MQKANCWNSETLSKKQVKKCEYMESSFSHILSSYHQLSLDERIAHARRLKPEEEWAQALLLGDEWANCLTHSIGLLFSFIGFIFLIKIPFQEENTWKLFNFAIYGLSLILLYAASTCYHSLHHPNLKRIFRTVDHCAIYVLIAGSYTPFTMLLLQDTWGWVLFGIVWSLAGLGILLKIGFRHRFKVFSTTLYLLMGWLIVIAADPLIERLHPTGLYWLLAGGMSYTVGVIFFALDKRRFYHAIWHLFVLGGSACHYLAILFYL